MKRAGRTAGEGSDTEPTFEIDASCIAEKQTCGLLEEPPAESRAIGVPAALAVVIPTYNERENILPLLNALCKALAGIEWEVIFVDDNSPDGTAEHIRGVSVGDRRVRVLERIGRSGLSSACIAGMLATAAPFIAVMDGDLQHDETVLPAMLERIKAEHLDIVIGSRNMQDGSMGEFSRRRVWMSKIGTQVSRLICPRGISDTMSGFFLVDSAYFRKVVPRLSGIGFKLLVDLLASSPKPVRAAEVPYHFRNRQRGKSKLNAGISLGYLYLLLRKVIQTKFAA